MTSRRTCFGVTSASTGREPAAVEPAEHDIADVLVDFTRTLSAQRSVEDAFAALGAYTARLLGVEGVGVLLLEEGSLVVATATTERAELAEQLEAQLDEGPCTESIRTGKPVLVPDLREVIDRFPRFTPMALEAGIGSIHALPIGSPDHLIGSLDLVASEPLSLAESQVRLADLLVDVTVSYLVSIRAHEQASELAGQLQRALDSRIVIEQAKGIIAGRHGLTVGAAFERIRSHARSHGQRVQNVAQLICDGKLDLTP